MSSSNRTTSKGGKGAKTDNKSHKTDKSDTAGKGSDKQQGNRDNTHSKSEDPSIKEKVRQLMDLSQRSEEEVCLALHECDNDVNSAINMLLENEGHGEWETRVKKKKNRQASASKQEKGEEIAAADEWNDAQPGGGAGTGGGGGGGGSEKDKTRNKTGPPRLHGRNNDSRGWRGREKQENERNLEEGRGDFHKERRGRPGGSTRGPGGGRGRGGGRAGGRFPPRGTNRTSTYNKPIETWDNSNTWDNSTAANTNHAGPDEWTTEEYTGSLADTKVFTPSVQAAMDSLNESSSAAAAVAASKVGLSVDNAVVINSGQQIGHSKEFSSHLPSQSPVQIGGTLSAAQTQYLNQLTQQNSDNIKQYGTAQTYHAQNSNQVYNAAQTAAPAQPYPNAQQYGTSPNAYVNSTYAPPPNASYTNAAESQPTQQPARAKTQRARVPPPSKIPASAVEMPGDLNNSIGYLDVQFGAMDFMSDANSYDGVNEAKYGSANSAGLDNAAVTSSGNMDLNTPNQNSSLDAYSPKSNTQSSISSALSQSLTNTDSIPQTSEHLTSGYNSAPRSATVSGSSSVPPAGLDLSKQPESHSYSQSSNYNSYQSKNNSYNVSTYSATQTSNSYVSNQANSSYANSQGSYNPSAGATYQNAYSSAASYQSNANAAFPSISQANSYPSNNQTYQQNSTQSVYGSGNTGLNNSSSFGNTTTSQYNSYSSANNHKLGKESSYDGSSSVSNVQTTASNVASTTSLSLSQSTVSVTKSTTTLAAKNSSSVISSIPPGVTPVMSTPYIMGQVPYFQQPVAYSYEEVQMLQQRLPHMTTPYYDMSYQTPTTLAAVRDGSLGNVGYSISDGRFTRGDNNASPVPSTLSQQTSTLTQGHQAQPILAGGGHPYFFTAALNTFPNYQFGTMYTQLPAATNAHGSSNSNQYPKPATYGSGYGNYDALNQTQEYNKSGYVGNSQGQKGGGVNASSTGSSANDLSAMYGKSHAGLGKGNSYDKQGFHSGTPPGVLHSTLHGGQSAGLAPSGTGYAPQVYIPTMTAHQQPLSTQLMHQPLHQMDVRHQGRRVDSGNNSGQRSQSSNQSKGGAKQAYQTSYWNQP